MSGSEQQPGNTWVICEDEDGAVNVTVILGFGECVDTLSGDGVGRNVVKHGSFGITSSRILSRRNLKAFH